jgi:hypothetical protein
MSPTRISDEKREKHWQMMLALGSQTPSHGWSDLGIAYEAWRLVQTHYDFLAAKDREGNGIPADDVIDEDDGA